MVQRLPSLSRGRVTRRSVSARQRGQNTSTSSIRAITDRPLGAGAWQSFAQAEQLLAELGGWEWDDRVICRPTHMAAKQATGGCAEVGVLDVDHPSRPLARWPRRSGGRDGCDSSSAGGGPAGVAVRKDSGPGTMAGGGVRAATAGCADRSAAGIGGLFARCPTRLRYADRLAGGGA